MSILYPKKVKHRKQQRGVSRGVETRGTQLHFGSVGLKAMEHQWVSSRQIEAARRSVLRYFKKGGKMWIRIFPDKPVTAKGQEVPMGGGKGGVDHYVFPVKPGRILFEIEGLTVEDSKEALRKASSKLSVRTKVVYKSE
jgi:large subunit ribosomal protein L16